MYVILTHPSPVLVDLAGIPGMARVLVYDQNINGLSRAQGWLAQNTSEETFRLTMGTIVPLVRHTVASELRQLEDAVLLRDSITGLSEVQQYMLKQHALGLEPRVVMAMGVAKYGISTAASSAQYAHLVRGNRPAIYGTSTALPHVLLNGPWPMSPTELKVCIRRFIIERVSTGFDDIFPSAPGTAFVLRNNGEVYSPPLAQKGVMSNPPYGITQDEMQRKHPHAFMGHNPHWEMRMSAIPACDVRIRWDPVFLDGTFDTPGAYAAHWLSGTLLVMSEARFELDQAHAREKLLREFIRNLVVGVKVEPDNARNPDFCFLDETPMAKARRIDTHYGGFQDFLQTPVSRLDNTYSDEPKPVPECGRDLWEEYLRADDS